jgi:hypothetical protein
MSSQLWCLLAGVLSVGPYDLPASAPAPFETPRYVASPRTVFEEPAAGESDEPFGPGRLSATLQAQPDGGSRPPHPALSHGGERVLSSASNFRAALAQNPEPFDPEGIFIMPADPELEQPLNTRRVREPDLADGLWPRLRRSLPKPETELGHAFYGIMGLSDVHEYDITGYYNPFQSHQFSYAPGLVQPYKLGWYFYNDFTFMPQAKVSPVAGSLQIAEWNAFVRWSGWMSPNWLFSWTGNWNGHWYQGPSGVQIPYGFTQLMSDFELAYQDESPWSFQFGFTPQISSDFERSLDSNAYMFDGRAVGFYRWSPELTFAFGAAYWNRVHNLVVPYAGVIWTPAPKWEFRLLAPKSRISYYAGRMMNADVWYYTSLEYAVDAYQVDIQDTRAKDRLQMSEYRLMAGVNVQWRLWNPFLEGGWVFDRHAIFSGDTPNFNVQNGGIVRLGLRY